MRENDTEPEFPTPDLLLDEFLKEYYHLFVLVSVFGALGVYLSSVREQGIYGDDLGSLLDIAAVASLTLVAIVATYLDFIFVFVYTNGLMTPTAVFSKKNALLAFFLVQRPDSHPGSVPRSGRTDGPLRRQLGFVHRRHPRVRGRFAADLRIFKWQAESEGLGSFLGFVAFGVYNVLLFVGALLVLSTMVERFSGGTDLFVSFSSGYVTTALLYFVVGIAIMPVIMLLGLLLYLFYYRVW